MLRGQDIVVLAAILGQPVGKETLPALSRRLLLPLATVHRSFARLTEAGLVREDRVPYLAQADEFLTHGLRYVFPPRMKGETRGVPAAWSGPPLRSRLADPRGPQLVWPHPQGGARGIALEPLYPQVPRMALRDPELYERLALVDALRAGDARIRGLAREGLREYFQAVSR